jgi:hypothetical protein
MGALPIGPGTPRIDTPDVSWPIDITKNLAPRFRAIEDQLGTMQESLSKSIGAAQPAESLVTSRHKWIMGGLAALSGAGIVTIAGLSKAFENVKGEKDAANRALDEEKKKKPPVVVGDWPLGKTETFFAIAGLVLLLGGVVYMSSRPSGAPAPIPPAPYPPRF